MRAPSSRLSDEPLRLRPKLGRAATRGRARFEGESLPERGEAGYVRRTSSQILNWKSGRMASYSRVQQVRRGNGSLRGYKRGSLDELPTSNTWVRSAT